MRAFLLLLYGAAAYLACMATLLYFIGFSGNLLVPKSVDLGAAAGWAEALTVDLLLLALFGLQHSVMARQGFKTRWSRLVPREVERSTYGVAACAVLALLFRFWVPIPDPIVWRVEQPIAVALLWSLFALGWVIAFTSTCLIDHFELFGLRQVVARWRQRQQPESGFRTPLFYRVVRHPLYAGMLLSFWAVPVMSAGRLLFAAGFSAYIVIGALLEERDLVRVFGDRYRRYREQVGMLLPRLRWPGRRARMPGSAPARKS